MSRGKVGDDMSTYASYTRQACNFVFPTIPKKGITGETRPRPGKFRINDKEANKLEEGIKNDEEEPKYEIDKNEYILKQLNYLFLN